MKVVMVLLLVLSITVFAEVKSDDGLGFNPSASTRGTITLVNAFAVGLTSSYGLALKDDTANSIWISNWGTLENVEFDLTGSMTGNSFAITNGIDADDQAYVEYGTGDQFFFGDWTFSNIGVFDEAGTYLKSLVGPPGAGWTTVTGVAGGNGFIYCSDFHADEIAWGTYTGTESSVSWTTTAFASVSGMSVYGNYLIACCQIVGADNIFIFELNPDGSVNMTPVWSADFSFEDMSGAGGVDHDGTYLWLYPQNTSLYQLTIDFDLTALDASTWGQIKTSF